MTRPSLDTAARASWISLTATAAVVGVHHVYREGWPWLPPSVVLAILPYLLVRRFRATGGAASLWAYGGVGALTIGGFGVVDGLLDHVTNAFVGLYTAVSGQEAERVERAFRVLPTTPLVGDLFYEATGVLEFVTAAVAAYYAYRFLRAAAAERGRPVAAGAAIPGASPAR